MNLGGLAGLSGTYGGYQEAENQDLRNRLLRVQGSKSQYDLDIQQGADAALAKALPNILGGVPGIGGLGGIGQGPQGPSPMAPPQQGPQMPPQPPQPMGGIPDTFTPPPGGWPPEVLAKSAPPPGGGPQAPFAARFAPSPGPSPGGAPMMPALQQRYPGAQSAGALPPGGPPGPQAAPPPQQMPFTPQQQPQGMPQGQPMGGMQPPQMMDWRGAFQGIVKSNPGAPPGAIIGAMDKIVQLMNPIERAQWAEQRAMFSQMMQMHNYNFKTGKFQYEEDKQTAEAKNIVDGMEKGITPPTLVGLWRMRPFVEAEAAKRGLNLSKLQLQFKAAENQVKSLTGGRMGAFRATAISVQNTIGELKELSEAEGMGRLVDLNALQLESKARSGDELAARYIEVATALRDEMASLVAGAYAPTESAWKQAQNLVNANYGVKQLNAALDELQRIIGFRLTAIDQLGGDIGGMGGMRQNPYLSGAGAAAPAADTGGWGGKPSEK